jgi:glycosyltransferase involved in cell wall biosynthesis
MSGPRVLFLTTSFPSGDDPVAGVFVLEHARAAALAGADVAVLHLDRRHDARRIRVRRDDGELPTWRVSYPYRPTALSVAAHAAAGVVGWRAVRRAGFDPQLVHAHFFLSALPAALLPRPFVVSEHWTIFLPEDPAMLSRPLLLGARLALGRARMVMPVSANLAGAMRAAGIRAPFRVVPNAVDTSLFVPGRGGGGTRLVSVGLLHRQKGVDVLLQAFAVLRRRRPGTTLDLVGDGPERGTLEQLAQELGLDDAVTFHGFRPKRAIAGLLGDCDLFVLASRFDNNPCVLVEAQAAGLPIVATRVGGVPEVVNGYGLLVDPGDVEALADRLDEALGNLDGWDAGDVAERARERYSHSAVGRTLSSVYREALGS